MVSEAAAKLGVSLMFTARGVLSEPQYSILPALAASKSAHATTVPHATVAVGYVMAVPFAFTPGPAPDAAGQLVELLVMATRAYAPPVASVPPQGGRKHPQQEFLQVDTTNILFICGGAFAGLEKIISRRGKGTSIGFSAKVIAPIKLSIRLT